jgi:putative intracellular protease/amidase
MRIRPLSLLFAALLVLSTAGAACAQSPPPSSGNVAILVFDGVQIIDFTGPYEVFGQARFNTFTVSATKGPLTTVMGQKIIPAYLLSEAPPIDVLVIPGGEVDSQISNPAVIDWIRKQAPSVKRILSVCNGAFILAQTGLLDGLTATTFYNLIPDLKKAAPKVHVVSDQRFVDNGKIITTAGISSGIDGSLHVVEVLLGKGRAQQVALNMEYQWRPDEGYARAALADGPLRKLFSRRLNLQAIPGSGEAVVVRTEGTTERWETQWKLTTPTSAADLRAALDHFLTDTGHWTPRGPAAGTARTWSFQDDDRRAWTADVDLRPGKTGTYLLAIRLEKAKA